MDRRGPRPRRCAGPRGPCCARSPGFPVPAPARCRPPSPPAPAGARRKCDGWAVPVRAGHALQFGFLDARAAAAAAGRQALAEAVPVIDDFQARSVQRQDHGDGLVLLVDGGDVGVVGVQCARRVVLAAVQAVVASWRVSRVVMRPGLGVPVPSRRRRTACRPGCGRTAAARVRRPAARATAPTRCSAGAARAARWSRRRPA